MIAAWSSTDLTVGVVFTWLFACGAVALTLIVLWLTDDRW
jgi:hypothetical protein